MLNKSIVMGWLGADPVLRYTQGNVPVARFSLACDRDFKDKVSGERQTDWINVVAWRQTAEFAARYFRKGRVAVVEGRLQSGSYTDQHGIKRQTLELVADSIYFGDSKPQGQSAEAAPPPSQPQPGEFQELNDDDGELPF